MFNAFYRANVIVSQMDFEMLKDLDDLSEVVVCQPDMDDDPVNREDVSICCDYEANSFRFKVFPIVPCSNLSLTFRKLENIGI